MAEGSTTVRWFMPPPMGYKLKGGVIGAYFAFGFGGTYPGINVEKKSIEPTARPVPEYEGRAFFIVDKGGFVVVQSVRNRYLDADSLTNRLVAELRRESEFSLNVNISGMTLQESFETTLAFFDSLDIVTEIEFTQLRKSNPHSKDRFMDETAEARVTKLVQVSEKPDGIDKAHPRIRAELDHVRSYARFSRVSGFRNGQPTSIVVYPDRTEIVISSESDDEETMASAMLDAASKVLAKLRRSKPPPI